MKRSVERLTCFVFAGLMLAIPQGARAGDRFALIVVGATGGKPYADAYWQWAASLRKTLCGKLALPPDHVQTLFEDVARDATVTGRSTREGVTAAVATLRKRVAADDVVLVFLVGHGSGGGDEARFNLVGPDMTADEWDVLLSAFPARLVVVNSASGSANFIDRLSRRGRIVIAATDSASQQYETVFPRFFLQAFDDPAADQDKDGRISIWEAFAYVSASVAKWYESKGQIATEHAVFDDTGEGRARERGGTEPGLLARTTYLDAGPAPPVGASAAARALYDRRLALAREVEELKARKASMKAEDYRRQLEKLLLELAEVSREIKALESKPH